MDAISSGLSGLRSATNLLNSSAQRISQGDLEPENIVNTQLAKTSASANIASIKAADEIRGTALDLLA